MRAACAWARCCARPGALLASMASGAESRRDHLCHDGHRRSCVYRGCVVSWVNGIFKNTDSYDRDALLHQATHGINKQPLFYLIIL